MFRIIAFLWIFLNIAYISADRVCGFGKHLKPVNHKNFPILKRNIKNMHTGFDPSPNVTELHNNGKTVIIKFHYSEMSSNITLGPYGDDVYTLEFLYFNWLKKSQTPEGTLPMELHMIFRNAKYKTYEIASKKNFGLTVWSFRYANVFSGNPNFLVEDFFTAFKLIKEPNTRTILYLGREMDTQFLFYLMKYSIDFYTYQGRLSAILSPCSADVIWVEFPSYIKIFARAYENIKQLKSFNNKRLIDQVYDYLPPEGPIFQNRDLSSVFPRPQNDFEYFNATSEDNEDDFDDYENDNEEGFVPNGANNFIFRSFLILVIIFGTYLSI